VNNLLGAGYAIERMTGNRMKHRVAPHRLSVGWRHIVKRDGPEAIAFENLHNAELGLANACGAFQEQPEDPLKLAGRRADHLQYFGGRRLLLQRVVQLPREPGDFVLAWGEGDALRVASRCFGFAALRRRVRTISRAPERAFIGSSAGSK
jgi:hypothetical protein